MKLIFSLAFCFSACYGFGQTITRYFDSSWNPVPKGEAVFQTGFVQQDNMYQCTSRWISSGKLYATSTYLDTNFSKGIGVQKRYFESGQILDSTVFDGKGRRKTIDIFTEDGKKKYHAFYDEKENYLKAIEYDETGNEKPGFITFQKQAMFPGGDEGWVAYLQTHLKADTPLKKKAPAGIYSVIVSFLVDKNGKIYEVKNENDPGYGTAQEAVRVIKNGPDWLPAVLNDKPVIYRQRQPITFQVGEAKNDKRIFLY